MEKESIWKVIIKSPLCLAIISFYFAMQVLNSVVVPLVHMVTDGIPTQGQMATLISEIRDMKQTCLGDRVATVPGKR